MNLPYDPAIPLQGTYPGKTIILKDTCTPVFTAALFTIVRAWKQCRYSSTDEWIKMWCIYIYAYPMDYSPPGSSTLGFSRQEYWSGLPLPSLYGILHSHKKDKFESVLVK